MTSSKSCFLTAAASVPSSMAAQPSRATWCEGTSRRLGQPLLLWAAASPSARGKNTFLTPHQTTVRIKNYSRHAAQPFSFTPDLLTHLSHFWESMGYWTPHWCPLPTSVGLCTDGLWRPCSGEGPHLPMGPSEEWYVGMELNPDPRMITNAQ